MATCFLRMVVLGALLGLGGVGQALAATVAYVASAGSGEIAVFALDAEGGRLDLVETVPFLHAGGAASPMAVSPDRRFLHVAARARPYAVVTFAIDPASGRLTLAGEAPLPASLPYVTLDRTGRYMLGASYADHLVTAGEIGGDGTLRRILGVLQGIPNAHAIVPDRRNRFMLVPALGSDDVRILAFADTSGLLARHGRVALPDGSGPRHLAMHPDLDLVYVLGEHDARVHVLTYDSDTGALTMTRSVEGKPRARMPANGSWAAADIHVTPDGRFLFASVRDDSTIVVFTLDEAGMPAYSAAFATEARPRSFAIDRSGRFLLAAGQDSDRVTLYGIDAATGALTELDRHAVGENPNWAEFLELP